MSIEEVKAKPEIHVSAFKPELVKTVNVTNKLNQLGNSVLKITPSLKTCVYPNNCLL